MIHPERIAHLVLKVRNLEESKKFYPETLGMHVMKHVPEIKALFLSFNGRDHHEIALFEIGSKAEAPKPSQTGMLHVAFRLRNEEDLVAAYKELKAKDVRCPSPLITASAKASISGIRTIMNLKSIPTMRSQNLTQPGRTRTSAWKSWISRPIARAWRTYSPACDIKK